MKIRTDTNRFYKKYRMVMWFARWHVLKAYKRLMMETDERVKTTYEYARYRKWFKYH